MCRRNAGVQPMLALRRAVWPLFGILKTRLFSDVQTDNLGQAAFVQRRRLYLVYRCTGNPLNPPPPYCFQRHPLLIGGQYAYAGFLRGECRPKGGRRGLTDLRPHVSLTQVKPDRPESMQRRDAIPHRKVRCGEAASHLPGISSYPSPRIPTPFRRTGLAIEQTVFAQ